MASYTTRELETIGSADELQISSRRFNGTLRPFVTIWVIRDGDDIYVRSAYGAQNGWFRRAVASGRGRVRVGGIQRDVAFDRIRDVAINERIDLAYHEKYDRYGPRIVGSVVGPGVRDVTLRLLPL